MKFLTIQEVAARLRVHPRTARKYIQDGRLQATRFASGGIRVSEAALLAFSGESIKPRAARSALESFLANDYSGEVGDVRACTIVDIFCGRRDEAARLVQHLAGAALDAPPMHPPARRVGERAFDVSDAASAADASNAPDAPGAPGPGFRFEYSFSPAQAKARFVLHGPPERQAQAVTMLASIGETLGRSPTSGPP